MQALCAEVLIEVQRNLAIRTSAQVVTRVFEIMPNRLVAIEFAIRYDPNSFILARNRLISGRKVDDAEPRMTESNSTIGTYPMALAVRTPVRKSLSGPLDCLCCNRIAA